MKIRRKKDNRLGEWNVRYLLNDWNQIDDVRIRIWRGKFVKTSLISLFALVDMNQIPFVFSCLSQTLIRFFWSSQSPIVTIPFIYWLNLKSFSNCALILHVQFTIPFHFFFFLSSLILRSDRRILNHLSVQIIQQTVWKPVGRRFCKQWNFRFFLFCFQFTHFRSFFFSLA